MTLYYILFISLMVLWFFSWKLNGYELLAPASLSSLAFIGGTLLAIIGLASWNKIELQLNSFFIVLLGSSCFSIMSCVTYKYSYHYQKKRIQVSFSRNNENNKHQSKLSINDEKLSEIIFPTVASWKIVLLIILIIFSFFLTAYEYYSIANSSGLSFLSLKDLMSWVRKNTGTTFSVSGVRFDEGQSILTRGLNKISGVCQYIFPFCFALLCRDKKRRKECFLFGIGCLVLVAKTILSTSRDAILHIILCIIITLFIQDIRKGKKPIRLFRNYFFILLSFLCLALPLFYFSTLLIGRGVGSKFIDYISFYFGAGIPSMQFALDHGLNFFSYIGEATFYGIYTWAYKLYLIPELSPYAGKFITLGSHASNIYTSYFRYFMDFGYFGVVILSSLAGMLYTLFYQWAKQTEWKPLIVWTCYVSTYLFDAEREEYIFSRMLTPGNLLLFLLIAIVLAWLEWPTSKKSYVAKHIES